MPSLDDISLQILDVSISQVHEHISILRRIRNSVVSPLCRMPYEIIVKIISFVPDPDDENEHVPLLLAKVGPICHRIWSILQNSPSFWGHVDFTHSDGWTFIFRCNGRPTRLWIRYGPSEVRNFRTDCLLHYWSRFPTCSTELVEEFRFYGKKDDFDGLAWIFANPLPRLQTLVVVSGRCQFSWAPEDDETWTISGQFPAGLRSIQLNQVFIPWEICLTNHLIDLDLDYSRITEEVVIPMSSFVQLLALCTRLEWLCLTCAGPDTQDEDLAHTPSADPAHLPNLRVLEIYDDALNIAYVMNNLRLPDTTRIHVEPSIDWPAELVNFTLPRGTRVTPHEGVIQWYAGCQESALYMGTTEFVYHADVDNEEFMEGYRSTFHHPFLQFVGFSTQDVTALELDFALAFRPGPRLWSVVFAALPALQRLSCASRGGESFWLAVSLFIDLKGESDDEILCPKLKELDLSKFELSNKTLMTYILFFLNERVKAGIPIQKLSLRDRSFEALGVANLEVFRRYASEVELPKAVDGEVSGS